VRVVVLTGTGGAFCAGGDVKGFAAGASGGGEFNLEQRVHGLRTGMELSRWLHEMPKPTLAIIPGPAAGAGLSLALACDLRIAIDTAKFTTAFSKIGLSGDYGGSYFLPYLVGAAKARELYFTADLISATEALEIGLINKLIPAANFASEATAYARRLAALPTVAIGYMKRNLNAAQHAPLHDVLDLEAMHMIRTFMTDDHKGAARAFVEKRAPQFKGR
jgi:2-(1,2-epoxy-1,2-dihydrophenyl)acetyl-CoA isomerase